MSRTEQSASTTESGNKNDSPRVCGSVALLQRDVMGTYKEVPSLYTKRCWCEAATPTLGFGTTVAEKVDADATVRVAITVTAVAAIAVAMLRRLLAAVALAESNPRHGFGSVLRLSGLSDLI
eukprot:jgi/Psemu1/49654/gm1.49654_g